MMCCHRRVCSQSFGIKKGIGFFLLCLSSHETNLDQLPRVTELSMLSIMERISVKRSAGPEKFIQ